MGTKVKKRRPEAAQGVKEQDAGEHQGSSAHKASIGGRANSDKMLKRWWTMIDSEGSYYGILQMSNLEVRQMSEKMSKSTRFQSHKSFSGARRYAYSQARMKVEVLQSQIKKLRYLKRADCDNS